MSIFRVNVMTPEEADAIHEEDMRGFVEWDQKLTERNPYIIGFNHFMSEQQVQWGHRAGINSGNGQHEGRMSLQLFIALGGTKYKDDPDWWKDDKKFYSFLREHPEMDSRPGKNNSRGEKFLTA